MNCVAGGKNENTDRAIEMIDEAAERGAKIICLPELFNMGYLSFRRPGSDYSSDLDVFSLAESIPGPTTTRIAERAREYGVYVIAPIFEKAAPGVYYNAASVIDPQGRIVGKYRKTHVPAIRSLEKLYFRPGSDYPVFRTDFGVFGILICYDRNFAENWRILALGGAEVVFLPTAADMPSGEDDVGWEMMLRVRAYENRIFVVGVNRTGREDDGKIASEFFGRSIIVDPRGNVLAKAGKDETIISATIDLDDVDRARTEMALFRDLRPELYSSARDLSREILLTSSG